MFYPGGDQMTILSFALVVLIVAIDLLTSKGKKKVLGSWTIWRFAILLSTVIALFLIPEDYRISITYRRHPDFLKYYQENKDKGDFSDLEEQYFQAR
jgi:hypothetical protein